jgi:glycosyltransferase involved in cell wall biosynthesis
MLKEIIYFTESSGYGGAERYLIDLVPKAKDAAETVSVALPFKKNNNRLREQLRSRGITVLEIPQYKAAYPVNFLIALRFLRAHPGAFLHFSLPHPDCCRWVLLAAALLRRKYIISELLVPENPFKAGWYFMVTHLIFNGLKKYSYNRAGKVIAICERMRDILVGSYGMPSEKIAVIYNGIEVGTVEGRPSARDRLMKEFGIREGSLIVTTVGRLAEQKGHIFLIRAMQKLVAEHPQVVLLLVGDGPLKGLLEAEIQSMKLSASVRMTGFRDDFSDLLAITDIFVFPSLNEGLSYILLEAMAAGKPVVATDAGGNKELVVDGETGRIVRPKDVEGLRVAIEALIADEKLRETMGEKGQQKVRASFALEGMIRKTLSFYDETNVELLNG